MERVILTSRKTEATSPTAPAPYTGMNLHLLAVVTYLNLG